MSLPLLILSYLGLALVTVVSTSRASFFVNEFDKKTNISGAVIGGVMLAIVTSLPEFITSVTSTVIVGEPGLAFGNVFGSNLFNILILAVADLIFIKHLFFNKTKTGVKTNSYIILMYVIFLLPVLLSKISTSLGYQALDIKIGISFSLISLLILVVYFLTVKSMSEELPEEKIGESHMSLRRILISFIAWGFMVVLASIVVTLVTDDLAKELNLSASFAGAIFLGIATSLPELTAVITLFRLRNYDVALGNILGSNMFNMTIISVVDIINVNEDIFQGLESDAALANNVSLLLILGLVNSIIVLVALVRKKVENKVLYILPSVLIIIGYLVYVSLSV
ncbi:MAG: sodium:calcium antiporter [Bacillota bacterium]